MVVRPTVIFDSHTVDLLDQVARGMLNMVAEPLDSLEVAEQENLVFLTKPLFYLTLSCQPG
jgi:hypothetical protein